MVLLRGVFDQMRPVVPPPLAPALVPYFTLLEELLLRGSKNVHVDVRRLGRELRKPGMLVYVRERVVAWNFGRIVKTVAHAGPNPPPVSIAPIIWPPVLPSQIVRVAELVKAVQKGLAEALHQRGAEWLRHDVLGQGWDVPGVLVPKRGRGQPRQRDKESLFVMGVVEEMFDDAAKPYAEVAMAISEVSSGDMKQESAYKRMKEAREEAPKPKGWEQTLWCERIQPLHVDFFRSGAASRAAPAK